MPKPIPGYVKIPVANMPTSLRTLSAGELARDLQISHDVAKRFLSGEQCQTKTARKICEKFKLSLEELLSGAPSSSQQKETRVGEEWVLLEVRTPFLTAANDLQYRVCLLGHRHLSNLFGRGKCYDLAYLHSSVRAHWLPKLSRHAEVCCQLRHPRLPVFRNYFPASDAGEVWWVVDEWVPGRSLSEIIISEDPIVNIPRLALQIAEGLLALHQSGIVLRDLSPETVLIAESGAILTDFELAKLGEGKPTVSRSWPFSPYRAPELGELPATPNVDLYSWSQIVTRSLLGEIPHHRELRTALLTKKLPADLAQLLERCSSAQQSKRPTSVSDILPVVQNWVKGSSS